MDDIMVSICCTTFNHEKYISEALDSFLIQRTNFSFEILLHDDASTDRTAEIIREYEKKYPDIIKPIIQTENQYSKGVEVVYTYNFSRAKGKYIALCEGDDYWTDINKLQKQVDYMESNSDCSLCVHAAEKVLVNRNRIDLVRPWNGNKVFTADDVILGGGGMFSTNSMLFPTILAKKAPEFYLKCPVGDYPLTIYLSLKGKVFYFDDIMSAYRVAVSNSWSSRMQGNLQKNIEHVKKIEEMLKQVDEYSNFSYSDSIKKHITENRFNLMIQQKMFKELKLGEYRDLYVKMNLNRKIKIFLKQYLPKMTYLLMRIKRKL